MSTGHLTTKIAAMAVFHECPLAGLMNAVPQHHPHPIDMLPGTTQTARQSLPKALKQNGFSLVELLIGILIGLFIVGGAFSLFLSNLDSSRRLLLEARLNQDLRAAADLVTRDLRRAGYWTSAVQGITVNQVNPNQMVTSAPNTVSYRLDAPGAEIGRASWRERV